MSKVSCYLYKHQQHTVQSKKIPQSLPQNPKQHHSLLSKLLMAHGKNLDPFQTPHIPQMAP